MSVGKRLRFEIFKRDGFRCKYCGASPMSSVLRVDHVVPAAEGGSDDPSNLVTACHDCNAGKSDVPLDETMHRAPTSDELLQQAENIEGFTAACSALSDARGRLDQMLADRWERATGRCPRRATVTRLRNVLENNGIEVLDKALDALHGALEERDIENREAYFSGIVNNLRASEGVWTTLVQELNAIELLCIRAANEVTPANVERWVRELRRLVGRLP